MHADEPVSDYSDLTAGHYEGMVLKRERHHKWTPYWCVLYGRQLTFYDSAEKRHVVGRIELQPGSRCDKERAAPSIDGLVRRQYNSLKKYQLRLKTKKGTHVFTYEDVTEQSRWQMAINNASQVTSAGVRLSWIPTPFTMVTTPTEDKHIQFPNMATASKSQRVNNAGRSRAKREDTTTLIHETDSDTMADDGFGMINPNMSDTHQELTTTL